MKVHFIRFPLRAKCPRCSLSIAYWQSEAQFGAKPFLRINSNSSTKKFRESFHDRDPDAPPILTSPNAMGECVSVPMQSFHFFCRHPTASVLHRDLDIILLKRHGQTNETILGVLQSVLDGVA